MEDYIKLKSGEYLDLRYYAEHGRELVNLLYEIGLNRGYVNDFHSKVGFAYTVLHKLDYDLSDLESRVPSRYLKKKG